MEPEDAEEYTQALGQIVAGSYRQVALGKRLGVPEALGLTVEEWVTERLGGYVRLSVEERREAVAELTAEGMSEREAADVLGVSDTTVHRDRASNEAPSSAGAVQEAEPGGRAASYEAVAEGRPDFNPLLDPEPEERPSGSYLSREASEEQRRRELVRDVTLSIADAIRYLDRPITDAEEVARVFDPAVAGIEREDWSLTRIERARAFLGAFINVRTGGMA